jgi:hypothetical protein
MSPLWLSIAPDVVQTRLMMTRGGVGPVLRARFPLVPKQQDGLSLLLRGISAWYGEPFCAVLDAASKDVFEHPERWARLLGDLDDAAIHVEWVMRGKPLVRDRFLERLPGFARSEDLLTYAATGLSR